MVTITYTAAEHIAYMLSEQQVDARLGIIDSQSVKTAEKGGTAATTRARKSLAASVM